MPSTYGSSILALTASTWTPLGGQVATSHWRYNQIILTNCGSVVAAVSVGISATPTGGLASGEYVVFQYVLAVGATLEISGRLAVAGETVKVYSAAASVNARVAYEDNS